MPEEKELSMICWPVGQGLFSQGEFRCRDGALRIVYDCGSKQMNASRDGFRKGFEALEGKPLDLLVISHFHHDHVNGLGDLLRRVQGVQSAWIPYMAPKTRLLSIVAMAAQLTEYRWRPREYDDLVDLLSNPSPWLQNRGVHQVWEIGSDHSEWPEREGRSQWTVMHERPFHVAWKSVPAMSGRFVVGIAEAESVVGQETLELITWMKPISPQTLSYFEDRISVVLGLETIPEWTELRESEWYLDRDIAKRLTRAIARKKSVAALREAYKLVDKHLNRTSLCLLARVVGKPESAPQCMVLEGNTAQRLQLPVRSAEVDGLDDVEHRAWQQSSNHELPKTYPTLLWCGDVEGDELEEILEHEEDIFRRSISHTYFWQVPHHGSRHSLCEPFYEAIDPAYGFISCSGYNYNHPSDAVRKETGARVVTAGMKHLVFSAKWV